MVPHQHASFRPWRLRTVEGSYLVMEMEVRGGAVAVLKDHLQAGHPTAVAAPVAVLRGLCRAREGPCPPQDGGRPGAVRDCATLRAGRVPSRRRASTSTRTPRWALRRPISWARPEEYRTLDQRSPPV